MITLEYAIKMLEARLDCMHRSSSGIDVDCNREKCDDCELNYAQGTVGEQQPTAAAFESYDAER